MSKLIVLRTVKAPVVLVTATLPKTMEKELEEAMLVPNAKYIRAFTYRPNIEI